MLYHRMNCIAMAVMENGGPQPLHQYKRLKSHSRKQHQTNVHSPARDKPKMGHSTVVKRCLKTPPSAASDGNYCHFGHDLALLLFFSRKSRNGIKRN